MGVINILDEDLSNKIAAGEVIERPASVVKEVVENSIDAGSLNITVEIQNAGKSLIKISDDGIGMDQQDAVTAFQRHATSKIKTTDDLFNINTFGFRGEALPSIAAVSDLKLRTRLKNEVEGTEVYIRGGIFQDVKSAGTPEGTIIEVRNIFFNTPVRKKYLKTSQTELTNIIDAFINLSIAENKIHFKLIVDNKEVYNFVPVQNVIERIYQVFGDEISSNLIFNEEKTTGIKYCGYFSRPELNRNSRKHQYIFVNNRYVKNIGLTYSIEQAYSNLLPKGAYPIFFLFLEVNPNLVDVNVHPTKKEVKFSNEYILKNFLTDTISRKILKQDLSYKVELEKNKNINLEVIKKIELNNSFTNNLSVNKLFSDVLKSDISENKDASSVELQKIESEKLNFNRSKYIGQVFNTYLLFEEEEDLIFIDQHALHERILYEKLKKSFKSKNVKAQRLLLPITIDITKKEMEIIERNKNEFEKAGFIIEPFGTNSIILHSVPVLLGKRASDTKLMMDIIDEILENENGLKDTEIIELIISTAACRSAVKAGDKLIASEVSELIKLTETLSTAYFCPHGRPTKVKIKKSEIEKIFLRR